ncbi:MAG TPA: hypothetical protein VG964_00545 [Candidatus Saccharimonadales bacterium]|nr:hypothetical protein [Candidatus Saccharimonadales bacterium]
MSEHLSEPADQISNPELEDTREFTAEEIAELGLLIELAKREVGPDNV